MYNFVLVTFCVCLVLVFPAKSRPSYPFIRVFILTSLILSSESLVNHISFISLFVQSYRRTLGGLPNLVLPALFICFIQQFIRITIYPPLKDHCKLPGIE